MATSADFFRALEAVDAGISHPEQRALFDYWRERIQDDRIPARNDFDPLDFPSLLPRIALVDVLRETGESLAFRYRLAGTEIAARAHRDPTGKRFDQLYTGSYLEQAQALYTDIVESRAPHVSERVFPVEPDREELRYVRMLLPLAADGYRVDMIMFLMTVIEQKRLDEAIVIFQKRS